MIDHNQYLKDRVDDQISWYDKKSRINKNWYRRLRFISITIALAIPILTSLIGSDKIREDVLKTIIAVSGALIGLIEGLMGLNKYHDLWTTYRSTAEGLKYHRFLFAAGAAPYDVPNAFPLFVQNAEALMASERANWLLTAKQNGTPDDAGNDAALRGGEGEGGNDDGDGGAGGEQGSEPGNSAEGGNETPPGGGNV